jgi:hypothetical protein
MSEGYNAHLYCFRFLACLAHKDIIIERHTPVSYRKRVV